MRLFLVFALAIAGLVSGAPRPTLPQEYSASVSDRALESKFTGYFRDPKALRFCSALVSVRALALFELFPQVLDFYVVFSLM